MHFQSILVVAAGLKWYDKPGGHVIVDRETARVCNRAAELAKQIPGSVLYATAGFSPKFGVVMNGVMAESLGRHMILADRIDTSNCATVFNTRGEMEAFAPVIRFVGLEEGDTHEIHLVVRDFHLRRSRLLLKAQMTRADEDRTKIYDVPVPSDERGKNLIREPLALLKEIPYLVRRRRERS